MHTSFSHIGPGYAFGGERANIMAKRLAYIRKHGSKFLFDGAAPPAPGWPKMPQPKAQDHKGGGSGNPALKAERKAIIAEHVAEGGSVNECAPLLGVSKAYCGKLWREIVGQYGWQAV